MPRATYRPKKKVKRPTIPLTPFQVKVAQAWTRMAYRIANGYAIRCKQSGIPLEDAQQQALVALMEAAQNFVWVRAVDGNPISFSTYAHYCIVGQLRSFFHQGLIRPPANEYSARPISILSIHSHDRFIDDIPIPEKPAHDRTATLDVREAIKSLSPRQKGVVEKLLRGITRSEIAREEQISQQRISQLARQAEASIRRLLIGKGYG